MHYAYVLMQHAVIPITVIHLMTGVVRIVLRVFHQVGTRAVEIEE